MFLSLRLRSKPQIQRFTLLLFFLSLSHIVVSEEILVNIFSSFDFNLCNILQEYYISILIDTKVYTPRGWLSSFSTNNSRETSSISNVSSITYIDHI